MTKTYLDIVGESWFRDEVERRLKEHDVEKKYCFKEIIPPLYRYRRFDEYIVADILSKSASLSFIGNFNDLYDGVAHLYYDKEKIDEHIAYRIDESKRAFQSIGCDIDDEYRKNIRISQEEICNHQRKIGFNLSRLMGVYVSCFSENPISILMWSHYADANKGICIEYDFNQGEDEKKFLFPVLYTEKTLDLSELLDDTRNKKYQYPVSIAAQCAILNKAKEWEYEQEWRIVKTFKTPHSEEPRWIDNPINIIPKTICFGFNFFKNFFYYGEEDRRDKLKLLKCLERLMIYMGDNNIKLKIMRPNIGRHQLQMIAIDVDEFDGFLKQNFSFYSPNPISQYTNFQYTLIEFLEYKEKLLK